MAGRLGPPGNRGHLGGGVESCQGDARPAAAERKALTAACTFRGYRYSIGPASGGQRQMIELLYYIGFILELYVYVLVASAILSWLIAFGVVNYRNQFVGMLAQVLYAVTEPVLRPIRRVLPYMNGIDLSPVVAILLIYFIQIVILPNIARAFI